MRAYATTDVGRVRRVNQDYIFCSMMPVGKLPNLFIVADGMGGHKAGDLASRFTVETLINNIKNSSSDNPITRLNRDEARTHKRKNVITRAIGGGKEVMADFFEAELTAGNRIIMCSDGLSNMVDDGEIEQILSLNLPIEDKAKRLIDMANESGGADNIAVVIVEL